MEKMKHECTDACNDMNLKFNRWVKEKRELPHWDTTRITELRRQSNVLNWVNDAECRLSEEEEQWAEFLSTKNSDDTTSNMAIEEEAENVFGEAIFLLRDITPAYDGTVEEHDTIAKDGDKTYDTIDTILSIERRRDIPLPVKNMAIFILSGMEKKQYNHLIEVEITQERKDEIRKFVFLSHYIKYCKAK